MDIRKFIRRWGASLLVVGIGLAVTLGGLTHEIGSAARMGPGYFPVVLGILLILLGLIVGFVTDRSVLDPLDGPDAPTAEEHAVDLRGWGCVTAGVVLFAVLGEYGGFVPATFMLVFVSALGDRDNTLKSAALLAAGVTVFGVLVFTQLLQINIPLIKFWS